MSPAAPLLSERLSVWRWQRAAALSSSSAGGLRDELLRALRTGGYEEVYRARNRRVLRVETASQGAVAVKEVRHRRLMRRLRIGLGGRSAGAQEFRAAEALGARGVATPEPLIRGRLHGLLGVSGERLVVRWLDGHRTLSRALESATPDERTCWLEAAAAFLVAGARHGLVHGGQSGDNLMVLGPATSAEFAVIDLADARLVEGFATEGLTLDALRLAAALRHRELVEAGEAGQLLEAVIAAADAGPGFAAELRERWAATGRDS